MRKQKFIKEYASELQLFTAFVEENLNDNVQVEKQEVDGFFRIGLFIFSKTSSGTLEDIIIPIMEKDNEKIFLDAKTFLASNNTNLSNSKMRKAQIGVVGQLKHHGKSNEVIIHDTKMISKEKITGDEKVLEILSFIDLFK